MCRTYSGSKQKFFERAALLFRERTEDASQDRVVPKSRRQIPALQIAASAQLAKNAVNRTFSSPYAYAGTTWAAISSLSAYNHFLLPDAQRDRIDVVLVSPRNPLNIGAAARACFSFLALAGTAAPKMWYTCVHNGGLHGHTKRRYPRISGQAGHLPAGFRGAAAHHPPRRHHRLLPADTAQAQRCREESA